MVRFISLSERATKHARCDYDDDYDMDCLDVALTGGHVAVAEFLWSRMRSKRICRDGFARLMMASARSASRAMLEWTVSRRPPGARVATAFDVFACACSAGDVDSVRYVCGICDAKDLLSQVHKCGHLSNDACVLRFLHDRFGYTPLAKVVSRIANNHGAVAYLLETAGDGVVSELLLSVPADLRPRLHAFLRSAGHRAELDLAETAVAVAEAAYWREGSVGQMEALMQLRPDPAEWVAELGPRLKRVLETSCLQASFAKFFKGHKDLDFEIWADVPADTFAALRAVGGSCGCRTFKTAIEAPGSVEHARAVWAAMAVDKQAQFRALADQGLLHWVPDVDMLRFIMLELGMLLDARGAVYMPAASAWSRTFTPELARFILEYQIMPPAAVLDLAATCGHLDVVKLVAPACTTPDLRQCLSLGREPAARAYISRAISERTHPVLRWLEWLKRCHASMGWPMLACKDV
jgi:hypothetical protein